MRMRWRAIALVALAGTLAASHDGRAVVGQLHVVSIHVRDLAAFDAVFFFFRDVLQLPRVYGEPSAYGQGGTRRYAGFSVGNAYIEPCGPYPTDAPFEAHPARFHGLTFTSRLSLPAAARELDASGMEHGGVAGAAGRPSFIYVKDPLLTGPGQAISFWQLADTNDPANPQFLAASLEDASGGVLGVRRMTEVRVGYPEERVLSRWRTLLGPAQPPRSDRWALGGGPAIRAVRSHATAITSIVLEVESLETATRALSGLRMLGNTTRDRVDVDPERSFGLRIELHKSLPEGR